MRKLLYISASFLLVTLLGNCEKELFHYAEITEYHAESLQLDVATTDSIAFSLRRFKASWLNTLMPRTTLVS